MSGVRHSPRHRARRAARIAAVTAGLFVCAAAAQQPAGATTTLYLVLRAGADVTEDEIVENLKKGLRHIDASTAGEPVIKAVSPAFVEELQALTEGITATPAEVAPGAVAIRRLPTVTDTAYELQIPREQIIKKLTVTYKKAKPKDYVPEKAGTTGLVLIVPGRYAFYPDSPEAGDTPVSFEALVAEFGKPDAGTVKGEWIQGDKYFVVTMRDFRGNRDKLLEAIQNKKVVANPFKGVTWGNNLELAFATLRASRVTGKRSTIDNENNIMVRIDTLEDREPARVWIYFPLDEKQVKSDDVTKLSNMKGVELSKHIRASNPVRATENTPISSTDGPRWYELPPRPTPPGISPSEFERKIKLADLQGFEKNYPKAWKLVVWEFDNGTEAEAILIQAKEKGGRYPLEVQEMPGWQQELQEAIKRIQLVPKK